MKISAAELMELFTLGIGHYTEDDVKQAARALTGWTVRQGEFFDQTAAHDEAEKTVFGRAGNWNGRDLLKGPAGTAGDRLAGWPGRSCVPNSAASMWPATRRSTRKLADWSVREATEISTSAGASKRFCGRNCISRGRTWSAAFATRCRLSSVHCGRSNAGAIRRARLSWPSGCAAWSKTCSIRPMWVAGRGDALAFDTGVFWPVGSNCAWRPWQRRWLGEPRRVRPIWRNWRPGTLASRLPRTCQFGIFLAQLLFRPRWSTIARCKLDRSTVVGQSPLTQSLLALPTSSHGCICIELLNRDSKEIAENTNIARQALQRIEASA